MPKDEKEGIRLFKKAFSKGHLKAGTALGMLYLFDEKGGSKKEGFRYTKKAAEGGEPTAMGNLANCYYYGNGTKKDRRLAKEWYGRASDAGMDSSTTSWESCTMKMEMMIKPLPFSKRPQTGDSRKPWVGWPPAISTAMVRR